MEIYHESARQVLLRKSICEVITGQSTTPTEQGLLPQPEWIQSMAEEIRKPLQTHGAAVNIANKGVALVILAVAFEELQQL